VEQLNTDANDMLFFQTKKICRLIPKDCTPVVVHFSPYFDSRETHQSVHNQIVKQANCIRHRVKTWREFIEVVREEHPDFITIHQSIIDLEHHDLENFATAIQSLLTYIPRNKYTESVPIAIGIEQDTTQNFVQQLKRAGFAGIWPTGATFGVDGCVAAMKVFLADQEYWPADLISKLPNPKKKPVQVYFRSPNSQDVTKIDPDLIAKYNSIMPVDFVVCDDWSELGVVLTSKPYQIAIHANVFQLTDSATIGETINMLQTQLKLAKLDIPLAIVVERTTPQSIVLQAKRLGMQGIVPYHCDWPQEDILPALTALTNRVSHWPRHIIDQLPGAKKTVPVSTNNNTNGIKLTVRQQEVMDLICNRGLSNKQIAKTLSLSESTVKIHVSAVMKSYGVRNRTQLALSAGTGLKA
jgi:DNA-binding NarL/FixJ family response regulator